MFSAVKILSVVAVVIACFLLYPYLTPQNISDFINRNDVSAPVIFITICSIRPILFFLPSMGLTIVAGVLFGAVWGTVYVSVGGALSTAVGYFFARWIGRDAVRSLVAKNRMLAEWEKKAKAEARRTVLSMRLFNLPWDVVSYWAGLQGIAFRDFYIASLIPLIPISFLYTYFGSRVFQPYSAGFMISLAIMFIMGAIPYVRARLRGRTHD